MSDHDLPILPLELWTEHIIPEIMRERDRRDWNGVTKIGNMRVNILNAEFFPSSFTLTALKRINKKFYGEITRSDDGRVDPFHRSYNAQLYFKSKKNKKINL
jgi:hypothetical protein